MGQPVLAMLQQLNSALKLKVVNPMIVPFLLFFTIFLNIFLMQKCLKFVFKYFVQIGFVTLA